MTGQTELKFSRYITQGVLHQLLSWSKLKHVELHSSRSVSDTVNISLPTDIISLLHLVIRQYDSCYDISLTNTGAREWHLKPVLPALCTLNRASCAVTLSQHNCCSLATILYVKHCQTGAARMAKLRDNSTYRLKEKDSDRSARQTARQSEAVRSRERSARKTARQNETVGSRERSADRRLRRISCENEDVRRREADLTSIRRNPGLQCNTLAELIVNFHKLVSNAPHFVCTSCDQLFYKHSVLKAHNLRLLDLPIFQTCLLGTISPDGIEYVCQTCNKYLRQNKLPPSSIANNLQFPPVPSHLPVLTLAEWRMLSPRIAFMQIHEAAVGKQMRIHGNVVLVPADVSTIVSNLPRTSSIMETIAVKLKRRSQYQHAFLTANIRPECVRQVGMYLVQTGELFKKENITFNTSILEMLDADDDMITQQGETLVSNPVSTNSTLLQTSWGDSSGLPDNTSNLVSNTVNFTPATSHDTDTTATVDDDSWNEVSDDQVERTGVFDTLFTSPDFIETHERQSVYGHIDSGQSDNIHTFAPAEHNRPVSIFLDLHSEELAFPNIFWGCARSQSHPVNIHYSDIVKSELRRRDRRVACCVDNLFYKVKRCQMQCITGKVNIAIRKHKTGDKTFTAGELRQSDAIDSLIKFDEGYRVLKEIRGSPPYWEKAQKELYAMIRQLGPANLFITLSAAETRWSHLLQMLSQIVDNVTLSDDDIKTMNWSTKCRLISSDPVTAARHFDYSIHHFFNTFLKSPLSPFGHLADFWYRIEFQHRGSPHMHCMLWISDAPVYGVSSTEDVISYIDKILTCQRSWDDTEIDEYINFQVHKHTRTCKKLFRRQAVCRFNFPKLPMLHTQILEPLHTDNVTDITTHVENFTHIKAVLSNFKPDSESITMDEFLSLVELDLDSYILAIRSSLKTATVFLKRSPSEVRVNNYNVDCLRAWRANMDIQFILSAHGCASYITSYVAKGERGMSDLLRTACKEAKQGNVNLKQQVRHIGNKFVNNVEMSAQEAVYLLLQLPLRRSSRKVVFVNTSPPEDRVYLLKSRIDMLPDDAQVGESNQITKYINRPSTFENICLADYIAFYDGISQSCEKSNSDDEFQADGEPHVKTSGEPKRRSVARVLRYVNFSSVADAEKSAREKLMLFTHWRNETVDLYGQFQTYVQNFESLKPQLLELMQTYEPFASEVSAAQEAHATDDIQQQWDLLAPGLLHVDSTERAQGVCESELHAAIHRDLHGQSRDYDLALDLGLGRVNSSDSDIQRYDMPHSEYFNLMQSLTCQQMEFVYDTMLHLKTSSQPVYKFVSGGAGTGKSYVLKALRESAERYFKSRAGVDFRHQWTSTLAPTGKVAFLVGGGTIHSILHVPANQALTYSRLDHESLNSLRTQIGHIKLWLVDEISMVGHRLFSFIDQRLQEVNNTDKPFGGASVVVFGDLFQLAPVMDGFIFQDFNLSKSTVEQYNALAPNLWSELFTMFELTRIMRQQDCIPFAELLNRLREGNHTTDDIHTLQSRVISRDAPDCPASAQHLFKTNAQVEQYNTFVYQTCQNHKLIVTSLDSVIGSVSDDLAERILSIIPQDSRKTMQLPATLPLAVGCRYEVSVNVNVSDGLSNGAGGVLQKIHITSDNLTASGIIWIKFDDLTVGLQTRLQNSSLYKRDIDASWTPIQPICRQFQVGKSHSSQVMRKQFPLRQSAAKTIHRCQGDTLDQVVVDFSSNRKEAHTHYVGLSRVKTLNGLFVLNLYADKVHVNEYVKTEMTQLRSERQMAISIYQPYLHLATSYQLCFLNTRSLHKHIDCIRNDRFLTACDLLMFCETRTSSTDHHDFYRIDEFNSHLFHRVSKNVLRSHYGLALYSKQPISYTEQPITLSAQSLYKTAECFFTVVAIHPQLVLTLACVYRRPNTDLTHFCQTMSKLLSELSRVECDDLTVEQHTLIIGDFNLHWFDQSTRAYMSQTFPTYRQLVSSISTDWFNSRPCVHNSA